MSLWQTMRAGLVGLLTKGMGSAELFALIGGGAKAKSGQSVTADTAMQVATVFACLRVIGEGVSQVPLKLFQRAPGSGTRREAIEHPVYPLIHSRPNLTQTAFGLRETLAMHAALTGDGFAYINRGVGGRPVELLPLIPGRVEPVKQPDWTMVYKVTGESGDQRELPAADVLHLRGPSWVGHVGLEVVRLAREAIGLAMASEESQARMHERGLKPSGLYSVDGVLGDKAYKEVRGWLEREHVGAANAGSIMILDRGAKFTPTAQTAVDAQQIETRRHQVAEICSFFRVMPIMIGYSDKAATYASAEQMFLAHAVHTLAPWCARIEQTIDNALLTDQERAAGFYSRHILAGLMRGALQDQAEFMSKLVDRGVMTRNEARGMLELDPKTGLDDPLTPINLSTDTRGDAGKAGEGARKPSDGTAESPTS